ncbi:DUF5317 domain-containing protein [Aquibacillus kalidii]|uniref:DUF5317 domain-containing protein n=1 Tax=Aquibacillus kalidii TaxID=2762597 RepID=UPI001644091E|nr:DUF5317 domain-containing protein [Aquibacillus kalidii]
MVVDGIVWSVIIGFLRKGNLKWLLDEKLFRWGWIFPVLLVLQFTIFYLQNNIDIIGQASNYIFVIVYVIGLIFLWMNRDRKGISVLFLGVLLNFVVMLFNGGRMPVSAEAALVLDPSYIDAINNGLYAKHQLLTDSTNLGFLGDIIPITSPYPKSQVISIGDVIMNIGIFIFIQDKMMESKKKLNDPPSKVNKLEGGEIV